jgi:hypothetical protein
MKFVTRGITRTKHHSSISLFTFKYLLYVLDYALKLYEFNKIIVALSTPLLIHFLCTYERNIMIVCYA